MGAIVRDTSYLRVTIVKTDLVSRLENSQVSELWNERLLKKHENKRQMAVSPPKPYFHTFVSYLLAFSNVCHPACV